MPIHLLKQPIFVDFDRRRRLVFNLNTEILIRNAGGKHSSLWETIAESTNPETGEVSRTLDLNLDVLRIYLWAALQADASAHEEILTPEDVGALLSRRKWVTQAFMAIKQALEQYYGDDLKADAKGEAPAQAVSA